MLPEMVLDFGKREAILMLVDCTRDDSRSVTHALEAVIFDKPCCTVRALVLLFRPTLILPEPLFSEF